MYSYEDSGKQARILLPRTFVVALLFAVFALSFIVTPLWNLLPTAPARLEVLLFTLALGVIWSAVSAGALPIHSDRKGWISFAILLIIVIALNYRQLGSSIPWRGDEGIHVMRTIYFMNTAIATKKWVLLGLASFAIFIMVAWVKPRWSALTGALIVLGVLSYMLMSNPFGDRSRSFFLRYPVIINWLAAIVPAASSLFTNPYREVFFRIIPLLSATALAWTFQSHLRISNMAHRLIWGISVATMPLVLYYSSILYLEMPAVVLMMVVCLHINQLLYDDLAQLKGNFGWYCLILIGFIKETAFPFLACFLICRWAVQFLKRKRGGPGFGQPVQALGVQPSSASIGYVINELSVTFSVLFPMFLYLILRSSLADLRSFGFQLSNLLEPKAYSAFAQSYVDQFGVFLLLFVAGVVLLVKRKEYMKTSFILLVFLLDPLFHIVDSWLYAGYSRFNLFLLPLILTGTITAIGWIADWNKQLSLGIAGLTILISLVITPINLDGSKEPYWGNYNIDTAEHYYPYREALSWLSDHPGQRTLSAGLVYPYDFDFYAHQLGWKPAGIIRRANGDESDLIALSRAFLVAEKGNYQYILFHVFGADTPQPSDTGNFRQAAIFRNSAHILVIYQRAKP